MNGHAFNTDSHSHSLHDKPDKDTRPLYRPVTIQCSVYYSAWLCTAKHVVMYCKFYQLDLPISIRLNFTIKSTSKSCTKKLCSVIKWKEPTNMMEWKHRMTAAVYQGQPNYWWGLHLPLPPSLPPGSWKARRAKFLRFEAILLFEIKMANAKKISAHPPRLMNFVWVQFCWDWLN